MKNKTIGLLCLVAIAVSVLYSIKDASAQIGTITTGNKTCNSDDYCLPNYSTKYYEDGNNKCCGKYTIGYTGRKI